MLGSNASGIGNHREFDPDAFKVSQL